MNTVKILEEWPEGISDGLTLPCSICKRKVSFDYHVSGDFWKNVVPSKYKLDVVCLPCLDTLASKTGLDVAGHLEFVQFTGIDKTIEMPLDTVYYYGR